MGIIDEVIVSTEDDQIAAVAIKWGAQVPFRRPDSISDEHTPIQPVTAHAVRWLQDNRGPLEFACCVFATAPLMEPQFLGDGLELLKQHPEADFVFSVTTYAFPIFRSLKENPDGTLSMNWPDYELSRSQDLAETWHDAAQFTWGPPKFLLKPARQILRALVSDNSPSSPGSGHRYDRRLGKGRKMFQAVDR